MIKKDILKFILFYNEMEEISLDEISENVPTQSIMEIENNTIKDSQMRNIYMIILLGILMTIV